MVFLDTSAIYALADRNDENHLSAKKTFAYVAAKEKILIHNYVIVESAALIQVRLGLAPAKKFLEEAVRFEVVWVDASLHTEATRYLQNKGTRRLSFVDCVSFVVMHNYRISQAFSFDDDFSRAGFQLLH